MNTGFQCAGCGEWNETIVDRGAGSKQMYVEDCQVCCKPNALVVNWHGDLDQFVITSQLESE